MINIIPNSATTLCILLTDYKKSTTKNYTLQIISNYTKEKFKINIVDESSKTSFSIFNIEISNTNSGSTGTTVYIPYTGEFTFKIYENPNFLEDLTDLDMIYTDKLKIKKADKVYITYNKEKTYKTYDPL